MGPAGLTTDRDHDLGRQLGILIARRGGPAYPPGPVIGEVQDLLGDDVTLLGPLRDLLHRPGFRRLFSDGERSVQIGCRAALLQELGGLYQPAVVARLTAVLDGCLGLPPQPPAAGTGTGTGDSNLINLLLLMLVSFLAGAVLIGLGWLMILSRPAAETARSADSPDSLPAPTEPATAPVPPTTMPTTAAEATAKAAAQPAGSRGAQTVTHALNSVEALIAALSNKRFNAVQALIGMGAADQFTPEFYSQFAEVGLQDLQSTERRGDLVTLEGVMIFRWPDGSWQSETRRFSVDGSSNPARIIASDFGRVLKPR